MVPAHESALGPASMSNIEQMLATAIGEIGELKGRMAAIIDQNKNAENSRKELHREINDTKLAVGGIMSSVAGVKEDIEKVSTEVRDIVTRLSVLEIARRITGARIEGAGWVVHTMRVLFLGLVAMIVWLLTYIVPFLPAKWKG